MAKKLFVGNLPFSMGQAQLMEIFKPYGEIVAANVVADRFSNRSKGFGFVEFANEEDAVKALGELNDSEQLGRKIVVKEALSKTE
jgi:RNA recognition motif-containing protein